MPAAKFSPAMQFNVFLIFSIYAEYGITIGNMKILLVEDDVEMAKTLKEELSSDYVIELAFFGKDGEYLSTVNDYDVIILDLLLPDIDGITVCQKIRANGIKTPVLILTGEA